MYSVKHALVLYVKMNINEDKYIKVLTAVYYTLLQIVNKILQFGCLKLFMLCV